MLANLKNEEIKEKTLFIYYEDESFTYGPNDLVYGEWVWSNSKRYLSNYFKTYITEKVHEVVFYDLENKPEYKRNLDEVKEYLGKAYLNKIEELEHLLIRLNNNMNQDMFNKLSMLLKQFNVKIEFHYYSNYHEALNLVKEHKADIYRFNMIKTFSLDTSY